MEKIKFGEDPLMFQLMVYAISEMAPEEKAQVCAGGIKNKELAVELKICGVQCSFKDMVRYINDVVLAKKDATVQSRAESIAQEIVLNTMTKIIEQMKCSESDGQ